MSEEKRKNDEQYNRDSDRLTYFLMGLFSGVPVALWAFGHLWLAQIWGIRLIDVILPVLDCVMSIAIFAAFTGAVYYAGIRNAGPKIISDVTKAMEEIVVALEEADK